MYSTQLRDLAAPILDFQNLGKLLAKRWHDYSVEKKRKDCEQVLGLLQRAVTQSTEQTEQPSSSPSKEEGVEEAAAQQTNVEGGGEFDWTKLGFETDDPSTEISEMGFLGVLDFSTFVQRDTEAFNKVPSS